MSTSIGTNSSTLATEIKNGSTVGVSIDTAGVVTMPATPNTQLGVGQTWQDVTASRALGVTYTNTTGKPIEVFFTGGSSSSSTIFVWYINNISYGGTYITNTATVSTDTSFIVPAGATYKIQINSGTGNVIQWSELR